MDTAVRLEGQPETPTGREGNPVLNWEWITAGYFEAMKIPILRGRGFDDRRHGKITAGRDRQRGDRGEAVAGPGSPR